MAQTKTKLNSTAKIILPPSDNLFEPIHFNDVFQYIVIYIFAIHDSKHDGLLKIGKTTIKINRPPQELPPNCTELLNAAKNRIKGYTNTAGIEFDLLYADIAIKDKSKIVADIDDNTFDDKDVHDILLNSGYERAQIAGTTAQEWFKVDLSKAVEAINSVKRGEKVVSTKFVEFPFRPEQTDAIDKTVNHFQKGGNAFLWNAKMRFGKTVCALQVIRKMNFAKTIIITHRPVVDAEWNNSFYKVFNVNKDKFDYYDRTKNFAKRVANERHFIYFASIQDLRGSKVKEDNDEIRYKKNEKIFDLKWDCIIVDEAHEGTTTDIGKNLIDSLKNENTKTLSLSGTPFNIIDKYDETNVYTWDYVMEQRAKANWIAQHHDDLNPYFNLPKMNIFTYNLVDKFKKYATENDDVYFNFAEFFRTDDRGKFVNEKDIKSFLDLLVDENPDSNYPYSREEWRKLFKHSLWMIPGVKEGKALSKLLKKHKVFKHFGIVNVAGDGDDDEVSTNALTAVQEAIKKNDYTITLSCGKLTMGVTVPEWSAVFMLYGSSIVSAASYMQTIFRVQSPCIINGTVKTDCFVFDFAPNRTLKMVAASAMLSYRAQDNKNTQRQNLDALLQFFPVIAIAGSQMSTYNVDKLMQQLKRAQADKVTEKGFDSTILYDEKLLNLSDKEINDFKDLRKILGVTAAKSKIKINSSEGILEKPFTSSASRAEKLINLALEKKLYLFEAVTTLHLPNFFAIRDLLPKIGNVKLIMCNYSQYSSRYDDYRDNHVVAHVFNPNLFGGALADINLYNINFVVGLFGMPVKISSAANIGWNGIDTSGIVTLEYENFLAQCVGAKDSNSPPFIIIQGDNGYICSDSKPNSLTSFDLVVRGEEIKTYSLNKFSNKMTHEFIEFGEIFERGDYDAVKRGLKTSLNVMTVLDAAKNN
ncbi:MAG: DEAD/DEAH box helicase family protein [Selenomonadaceae bacterium]|nr:DEAD/DEAH box helicase family protein [Selenomonadaceae bacterium]